MKAIGQDTLKTRRTLTVQGKRYDYFSLTEAAKSLGDISRLPVSLKVLLENVLRFEDGVSYTVDDAKAVAGLVVSATSASLIVQVNCAPTCQVNLNWSTWGNTRWFGSA